MEVEKGPDLIPVFNSYGDKERIPSAEVPKALSVGYKLATQEDLKAEADKEKYGSGLANTAKAFVAGAARTPSFGLSDFALPQTGLTSKEELAGLKKYNPAASIAGEVAGVVPALFAAPAEPAVAGVAGAVKVGQLAAEAAEGAGALRTAAQAIGAPMRALGEAGKGIASSVEGIASPIVNKAIARSIGGAAGSGVEAIAYGLGQNVSEHFLGDTDVNGEKILHDGLNNFLLGGTLGAAFAHLPKRATEAIHAPYEPILPPQEERLLSPRTLTEAIEQSAMEPESRESLLKGLGEKKKNASDIEAAAMQIGAPVLDVQTTESKHAQKYGAFLMKEPSIAGRAMADQYNKGIDAVNNAVDSTLGKASELSEAEIGNQLKQGITQKFEQEYKPVNELYDRLSSLGEKVEVSPVEKKAVADEILKIKGQGLRSNSASTSYVKDIANDLLTNPQIKTVDDLRNFSQEIGKELSAKYELKHVGGQIQDMLKELEENSVIKHAENHPDLGNMDELLALRKSSKAQYRSMREKMGEIGEMLGKKKFAGPQQFLAYLDDTTPEKITKKLFAKNNSEAVKFMQEQFPEELQKLVEFEKGKLRGMATKDGIVNGNVVLREVDKLSPELQATLFNPDEMAKLKASRAYLEAMPKDINPSGTGQYLSFKDYYADPLSRIYHEASGYIGKKGVEAAAGKENFLSRAIAPLKAAEKKIKQVNRAVKSGIDSIFSITEANKENISGFLGAKLSPKEKIEEHDRLRDQITMLINNPEQFLNHLNDATKSLSGAAPEITQAAQATAVRAAQFLSSKFVQPNDQKFMNQPYRPNSQEVAKFQNYATILNKPTLILQQINDGTVTQDSLEALDAVYPKLLADMQAQVMEQMGIYKHKHGTKLPYKKKMGLSLFLGQPLVSSLDQNNIQQMQQTLQGHGKEQAQNEMDNKVSLSQKGLSNLTKASRLMTDMQSSSQRA